MRKINCWEYKGCRKEENDRLLSRQKCLVPEMSMYDGINSGKNAGRACWLVADTTCNGDVQLTFSHKLKTCAQCDFYRKVKEEEGDLETPLTVIENLCNSG
jgi:predicted RNA-binding protein YlxR (DUF448 family)